MAIRSYARIKLGINSPQMAPLALWGDLTQFWLAQTTKQPQVVQLCRRCPRKEYRVFFICSLHNCTTSSLDMQTYNHAPKKEVQRRHSPKRVKGAQAAIPWRTIADLSLLAAYTCGAAACCWRIRRSVAVVRATRAHGRAAQRALHDADMMSPLA